MYENIVPQGLVLRKIAGGEDALKQLMLSLKKHSFSGFIEIILQGKNTAEAGYVLLQAGVIQDTFYLSGAEKITGENASKKIWQISKNPRALIVLHGQVNLDSVKKSLMSVIEGKEARKEDTDFEMKIAIMRSRGQDTSKIEALSKTNQELARKKLNELENFVKLTDEINKFLNENAGALKELSNEVEKLRSAMKGMEEIDRLKQMFETLKTKVRETESVSQPEIESKHLKELEELIRQQKEDEERTKKEAAVYNLVIQHKARTDERTEAFCPVCGSTFDMDGQCTRCSIEQKMFGRIVGKFSMANFIVGASNRFAYAVAMGISKYPGTLYNPVFFCGSVGCGKTHLMHAIAGKLENGVLAGKRIIYTNIAILNGLFEKYPGDKHEISEKLTNADALFIDNFEEIAGNEGLQAILGEILNKLVRAEKQVVIASKLMPAEIPKLDTGILLCLTAGLIVNIQEPDMETKRDIIKRYVQEHGMVLDAGIINYIATINLSVNDLFILLNRIFALASISNSTVDMSMVKTALKEYADKQGVKGKLRYNIQKGHSYLVEEIRPNTIFQIVISLKDTGSSGVVFSRINPRRLIERFEKLQGVSTYWLTEKESTADTIGHSLERIVYIVEEKLGENPSTVIALDGIEYLVSANGFDAVVKFIRRIVDMIAETDSILLVSLGESTLKEQEIKILERELEVLRVE